MEERRSLGIAVGEYQGSGQGENVASDPGVVEDVDVEDEAEEDVNSEEETETNDMTLPLLFFFDIETTGFQVYDDAITDIGAKVVNIPPTSVSQPSYTSLVMTSRNIPERGTQEETFA